MRTAYSGRAAAYSAKRDYDKALLDQNMVVLLYALEVEITNDLDVADRDKLMREAADAYRVRGDILIAAGKVAQAEVSLNRAEKLEAEARKLADKKRNAKPDTLTGELHP